MNLIVRPLRGLLITLAVLALSAGVVLGARSLPQAAADGLARASEASGQTVALQTEADEDQDAAPDVDEDADEDPDADESSPDADGTEATDTHGALVSAAAEMDTPVGFDNHGAFVSCVARMNHGHDTGEPALTPADLATLTPEDCAPTTEATTGAPAATTSVTHGKSDTAKSRVHGKSTEHGHRPAK